jgi:hypothetical protein
MAKVASANPEMMAGLDLDKVFESAVIKGILAITWRDSKGEPVKDANGNISRGLPKLMAEDFWRAYGSAKREGMQKIAEVIAKTMAASQVPQEILSTKEESTSGFAVNVTADEPFHFQALPVDNDEKGDDEVLIKKKTPRERRVRVRSTKRALASSTGTNGVANGITNGTVESDSSASLPEAPKSSSKAAH